MHTRDKNKGYPQATETALGKLQVNMEAGVVVPVTADWPDVHRLTETLSKRHTMIGGHRAFDVLHVGTALHLGARDFLRSIPTSANSPPPKN